jgi:two-component system, OmpR family, response regulator ResD
MTADRRRVLVVDDEGDIRTIVGLNLTLNGMEFGEAPNGEEAMEMIHDGDWDACVLDLAMPKADGYTVLKELTSTGEINDLVVVVLSARGAPAAAIKAMEMGAHAHLTKPFSPAAVAKIIEELIQLPPEEREERRTKMIERAGALERLGVPTV